MEEALIVEVEDDIIEFESTESDAVNVSNVANVANVSLVSRI